MDNKSKEMENELNKKGINNNSKKQKKSKMKKIFNIIEYIVIFIVITSNVILIFKSVNNPNRSPSVFGKKAFVIISGSMIPKIQIGDVVIINETDKVAVGDIIAFRRDSSIIVHRIVKEMNVNGQVMYQTKGDNNNVEDKELVDKSIIEGVMIGKIPVVGRALMWMYNNLPIVIVILVFFIFIRYFFTRN